MQQLAPSERKPAATTALPSALDARPDPRLRILAGDICAFGLDKWLFLTHIVRVATSTAHSCYGATWREVSAGLASRSAARIQWFTGVKAVANTLLVVSGFKRPPSFKVTPKKQQANANANVGAASSAAAAAQGDFHTPDSTGTTPTGSPFVDDRKQADAQGNTGAGGDEKPKAMTKKRFAMYDTAANVTEQRKKCMPMEGTFDIWVLAFITLLNFFAAAWGVQRLLRANAFLQLGSGDIGEGVLWLGAPSAPLAPCWSVGKPIFACKRCSVDEGALGLVARLGLLLLLRGQHAGTSTCCVTVQQSWRACLLW